MNVFWKNLGQFVRHIPTHDGLFGILKQVLCLTTNRSSVNSVTEFITMCLWLQENNFHPTCINLLKLL